MKYLIAVAVSAIVLILSGCGAVCRNQYAHTAEGICYEQKVCKDGTRHLVKIIPCTKEIP